MESVKISVIIPAYNVERYIGRCIDSLLKQKEQDFEILLIDDGSSDGTGRICDHHASRDQRIRVFHKPNGGVSSARNIGLDNARGKWLAFVDADDEVSEEYLTIPEEFSDYDVIQKGYEERAISGVIRHNIHDDSTISDKKRIEAYFLISRTNALWDKIIRREITSGLQFDPGIKIGEDFMFFLSFINRISKWGFSSTGEYFYWHNEDSAMRQITRAERLELVLNQIDNIYRIAADGDNHHGLYHRIVAHTYMSHVWNSRDLLSSFQIKRVRNTLRQIPSRYIFRLPVKSIFKFYLLKLHLWRKA